MTRPQKIKLNMYLSLRNLRNLYADIIKKIAKFDASFDVLQSNIDQIQQVSEQQGINKTGLTIDKNKLKVKLIALTLKYASKVAIYAKLNNNETLLKEVKLKESDLDKISGVILRDKAQVIYSRVEANIGNLEEQGITSDTQKQFQNAIIDFNKALSTPRTGIAERRMATQKLPLLFDAADAAIEIMDLAAESAKDEQPDFFNAYKTSRTLVDMNTGKIKFKGIAVELLSQKPMKGVTFSFRHNGLKTSGGNGNGEIHKKTADKGSFIIKNIETGIYNIAIKKPGYKEQDLNVTISEGERSELRVELEKA